LTNDHQFYATLVRQYKKNSFTWSLCSEKWETFAKLLSIFRDGRHHYLDCFSTDDTQIMVSQGEYPDNWVGWNEEKD